MINILQYFIKKIFLDNFKNKIINYDHIKKSIYFYKNKIYFLALTILVIKLGVTKVAE